MAESEKEIENLSEKIQGTKTMSKTVQKFIF